MATHEAPTPDPAAPAIVLRDIDVSYDRGRTLAVAGVSVSVARGAFVALVGGSGSGKTSLLKTINRLVEPWRGGVEIEGTPADAAPAPQLRRRIGYAFQGIGLFPHMSVGENIAATPTLLGWPRDRIRARVDALLDLVELPRAYADRRPDELSGGQSQRVGLARALAAEPRIVLLDEAFGALDPITRVALGDAYRAIHDRLGTTTILVTHDMQEALLLADRIIVMQTGKVVADDAPRALMSGAAHGEAARLMDMPRRQAERLQRLMSGAADAR
jgi:osmoprotectant transport system ATP-binding protein